MREIWYKHTLHPDEKLLREQLWFFDIALASDVAAQLEEPEEGKTTSRGQAIRLAAVRDAQEELRRGQQRVKEEFSRRTSAGFKRHVRRLKAEKRRGTNPRDIY